MKTSTSIQSNNRTIEQSNNFHRGSALLIVLGMLSFMVVSAVAFSAFMRQGRMPSSFLRQKILARELVKAGLAQAMTEVDDAIRDAKWPSQEFGNSSNRNYWRNRVYMGGLSNADGYDYETGLKETVSTFPLEGLAYMPPSLVNTIRHWSRRSAAAKWKNLDYDSGRWAFTAVNVSDYLDINRLRANVLRDSSPSNRISLAYLFENENHTDFGDVEPKAFDDFIDKAVRDGTYGRLVSLADYAMAIGSTKYGDIGFKSPFYEFIRNPAGDGSFYGSNEETAKLQKFVTDTWFPSTNDTAAIFLSGSNPAKVKQPLEGLSESLDQLQKNGGNEAFKILRERLDLVELASLYDYIDADNIPISLAIPTLERVPMLTGIQIEPSGFKAEVVEDPAEGLKVPVSGSTHGEYDIYRTWKLNGFGDDPKLRFTCCGVFPFKRSAAFNAGLSEGRSKTSYDVQVMVKAFLSDTDVTETRLPVDVSYRPTTKEWTEELQMMSPDKAYMTMVGKGTATLKSSITQPNDTVFDVQNVQLRFKNESVQNAQVFGTKTEFRWDPSAEIVKAQSTVYDVSKLTLPLRYRSGKNIKDITTASAGALSLKMVFICYVRILDGDNTVDLVPARFEDDLLYNNFNSGNIPMIRDPICGGKEPVLPITTGELLKLDPSVEAPVAADNAEQGKLAIYCDDPRFNYAPEDWYSVAGVQGSEWLGKATSRCNGEEPHRQHDIFQFVSNQDYLQSMGELQFLPYTRKFGPDGNPISGSFFNSGKYDGKPFAERADVSALANREFTWKTHYAFGPDSDWERDGNDSDPYSWGIFDTDGGACVNYFADTDLFMAALANTPYDYIVAAEKENEADKDLDANYDKYCFNEASSEAKMKWETQLKVIAQKMKAHFVNGDDWREWPDWGDDDNFFGQSMPDLSDVDRKFLFSYWKPCFSNNQQLFLFFVRAEPTVIGGSSGGYTPSQLGARAVALVWREPVSSITETVDGLHGGGTYNPHRMRILFYHQFD